MNSGMSETSINEYGQFDDLNNTVDKYKAKAYFEKLFANFTHTLRYRALISGRKKTLTQLIFI